MFNFGENYVLYIVLIGTTMLGLVAGIVGVFTTLRKESLIGDTLSHATLPGVVLSFILFEQRSLSILLLGALVSSIIVLMLMHFIKKFSRIKNDAILAILLSSFFGFGQVLLTIISNTAGANQAGLSNFIFGQAATMSVEDITLISIILAITLLLVLVLYKQIKVFIFNEAFYASLGFSKLFMQIVLSALTILIVIVSIKSVGVILMSAMLVAPAIAARQWSNKLSMNLMLAALFGAISGFLGTYISSLQSKIPTGPVIVIISTLIVFMSLIFSFDKGIIVKIMRRNKLKKDIKKRYIND